MSRSLVRCCALAALLGACNSRVDSSNPYDPQAPIGVQQKGKITGTVTAEAAFLASEVAITIDGIGSGNVAITDVLVQKTPGQAKIDFVAEVPPGSYHLAVRIPTFQPLDRFGIGVGAGATQPLGDLHLAAGRGALQGRVAVRNADNSSAAPPIDTHLTLFRLTSQFGGAASGVHCTEPDLADAVTVAMKADGTFASPNLAAGPYLVLAE